MVISSKEEMTMPGLFYFNTPCFFDTFPRFDFGMKHAGYAVR
jgi:hypothetical protein